MDEKTESLRNIFIDVSGQDTVTERQEESPGTLTDAEERSRVVDVIEELRDRYDFRSGMSTDGLYELAVAYFDDEDDKSIAETLDCDPRTVFHARLDLHLPRDSDAPESIDMDSLRQHVATGGDIDELLDDAEVSATVIERAQAVIDAERQMRQVSYRFRDELTAILGDGDLSERFTESAKEDGLEDATEGMETNTSF